MDGGGWPAGPCRYAARGVAAFPSGFVACRVYSGNRKLGKSNDHDLSYRDIGFYGLTDRNAAGSVGSGQQPGSPGNPGRD